MRYDSTMGMGQWFTDCHHQGEYEVVQGVTAQAIRVRKGQVLYMDGRVDWEDTPFGNGSVLHPHNLQNP